MNASDAPAPASAPADAVAPATSACASAGAMPLVAGAMPLVAGATKPLPDPIPEDLQHVLRRSTMLWQPKAHACLMDPHWCPGSTAYCAACDYAKDPVAYDLRFHCAVARAIILHTFFGRAQRWPVGGRERMNTITNGWSRERLEAVVDYICTPRAERPAAADGLLADLQALNA